MEHKVKILKVLERHKIHPKAKAQMNIPLCYMISMSIVKLASRSMWSRWNRCSKWAIEKVTKFSMSFPQTSRGRRHLLHITSMNGMVIGRLWIHHLRMAWTWMEICKGLVGECLKCGMTTIGYKHGCFTFVKFTHMTLAHNSGFHHVGYKRGPHPPPHYNDKHE